MFDPDIPIAPPAAEEFERLGPLRRLLKRALVQPLGNYLPAGLLKALLRLGRSELAAANWKDPGGWRSMLISYEGRCTQVADRVLVSAGTIPMALRNRRLLAAHLIAALATAARIDRPHLLYLGAGAGQIILDAMAKAPRPCTATLVDYNAEAIDFGRRLAERQGLADRVRYVRADVRHPACFLDPPPHIFVMLGLCEYLSEDQLVTAASAVAQAMPDGAAIVCNSLLPAHGTDRFFRRVFGLHMIHRSDRDITRLMGRAGFGDFATHPEPLGVYHVIVGRKRRPAEPRTQRPNG